MLAHETLMAILLGERLALTAFFAVVTRNYHLAEDVFQDVCVKAVGRGEPFESREHLLNWARLAGRNRAIDLLRARDGRYEGLSEATLAALATAWPDSETSHLRDKLEALATCIGELTANNREILQLRYFEGRSGAEVAQRLGRKLETLYQALARIHKTLGECIARRIRTAEGEAYS